MRWFGKTWEAPVCDPVTQIPTPVGSTCAKCKDLIDEHDRGFLLPYMGTYADSQYVYHKDCFAALVMGEP